MKPNLIAKQQTDDYDSPWKEAIEEYFEDCMAFFFPLAHADIDWQKGYQFRDKEFQRIAPKSKLGGRYADKLIEVYRKNEGNTWILIHLEVQSQYARRFAERMYIYHYRLFDRYNKRVVSFAILGDTRPKWKPKQYGYDLWGFKVKIEFPIVKLLDYKLNELEQSNNPFAIIVLAHLHSQLTKHNPDERYNLKWNLIRRLYERKFSKQKILSLFKFIDWLMALPPELEQSFEDNIAQYEEEQNMPYITSAERIGIKKGMQQGIEQGMQQGMQQGIQQGIQQGMQKGIQKGIQQGIEQGIQQGILQEAREVVVENLQYRFGEVPPFIVKAVNKQNKLTKLKKLRQQALIVDSTAQFIQLMEVEPGLQTARKAVIQVLKVRFGELPLTLVDAFNQIEDLAKLEMLLEKAVTIESIEKFRKDFEADLTGFKNL